MNKCYYRIVWENYPSDKTPLNEQNLNRMDASVDEIDNRIISLDSTKFDKSEAQLLVKYIEYDEDNGIFTITHYNGAKYTIDTLLEKLAINFDYDYQTQRLIIELSDGEIKYVDLSALITQYEFLDSDTVAFSVDGDGKVTAIVKEGSIEEKHLRPDYLAEIKVEVAKAQASQEAAATSETNAKASESAAKASETAAKKSEDNAASSATNSENSATLSGQKAAAAATSAAAAKESEDNAESAKDAAEGSARNAKNSENASVASATSAADSASTATAKATDAETYAGLSQSYAVGTNGEVRENDNADNSKYYYEQTKQISQSFSGVVPMGTITFDDLDNTDNRQSGYMFNISDSFVSDERFQDGGGIFYGAGSNVIYTADGMWDVLAATMVSGVKGSAETEYRQGFVNISAEDIAIETATTEKAGIVKPDGKTITVDSEGTIVGASSGFTGTLKEAINALDSGELADGTIVNIIDDYENSSVSIVVDDELSDTSENPVQNKVIYEHIAYISDVLYGYKIMKREQMASYGYYGVEWNVDDLMTLVKAGKWDKFAVGDYFIETNTKGEKIQFEIAGKNSYLHCGDNQELTKPHIVVCPRDCLQTYYKYNSSNTNAGGYAASLMPANLETEANKFTSKLQGYMTQIRRLENNKGAWAWTSRRIFLPGNPELVGFHGWADQYDGGAFNQLPLFVGGNAHLLKGAGFNKSKAARMWYWTADPSAANTTSFCNFHYFGLSSGSSASADGGVAPLIVLS